MDRVVEVQRHLVVHREKGGRTGAEGEYGPDDFGRAVGRVGADAGGDPERLGGRSFQPCGAERVAIAVIRSRTLETSSVLETIATVPMSLVDQMLDGAPGGATVVGRHHIGLKRGWAVRGPRRRAACRAAANSS